MRRLQSCADMFAKRGDPWSDPEPETANPVQRTAYGRKADDIKRKHDLPSNAYPKEGRVSLQGRPDPDMDRWTEAGFKKPTKGLLAGVKISTRAKDEPLKLADSKRRKALIQFKMRQKAGDKL